MRHAPAPPRVGPEARRVRRLAAGYGVLCVLTTGLIVLGALVRAHGAGLACPDWPLCFGQVIPPMDLRVAFEWGHRVTAGTISLLFVGLSVATLRAPVGREVRGWIAAGAALLALQVLLGALTVWQLLASWTVTSHLVVGNGFNACLFLLALRLREAASGPAPAPRTGTALRVWVGLSALFLLFQVVFGGLVSANYAGMACPEFPTCNGGVWFPAWSGAVGLHVHHRVNAVAMLTWMAAAALCARGAPRVARLATLVVALALVQATLGVANVLLAIPVEVTALHSLGAALLCLAMAATLRATFVSSPIPTTPEAG